jgi:16S rRNA (guanine966-N2)-methyltransferase
VQGGWWPEISGTVAQEEGVWEIVEDIMRISGGAVRGIPLAVPKGGAVRPSTDGMRQAVFSSLGARVVGARFWDLFAGSGAYGLEALSRGAAGGIFVERNAKAIACVKQNLSAMSQSGGEKPLEAQVVTADALTWVPPVGLEAADLVFIDPPYEIIPQAAPILFAHLAVALAAKPEALILFELPGGLNLAPEGWTEVKRLGKGTHQPTVAVFRRC